MEKVNRVIRGISTLLLLGSFAIAHADPDTSRVGLGEKELQVIRQVRTSDLDSAIGMLRSHQARFVKQGNYPAAIRVLLEIASSYGTQARYREAYDQAWKALFLADSVGSDALKAEVYLDLGRRYSFFKRRKEALRYFNISLALDRKLVAQGKLDRVYLFRNFYAMSSTFREFNEPALASRYLDSALVYHDDRAGLLNRSFLKFEQAYVLNKKGKYQESLALFREIEPWFLKNYPSYLVLVYTYWGDVYQSSDDGQNAITYYSKALEISGKYNSHLDFTPLIYERMAGIYRSRKNYEQAFQSLARAKALNERYFDSRSTFNRPLLEIQDEFRLEKERGRQLAEKQRLTELEYREQVGILQKTLMLLSLLFLVIIGVIFYRSLRARHRAEKELMEKKRELEARQAEEMIELRNKELTTSALKLIEKDELLATLKKDLSGKEGELSASDIKRAIKTISVSNTQNWQEFEARFVSVNSEFYQRLHEKFPDLTPGEQKLCALIKLNFSSKDIAQLLGISVGSAHTTRHRLRKKLGLDRDENLTEFIATL
jgi:tetratricopeptide (TPR) repeat protein/DNA-binding CsgD family transcriptional regulator